MKQGLTFEKVSYISVKLDVVPSVNGCFPLSGHDFDYSVHEALLSEILNILSNFVI